MCHASVLASRSKSADSIKIISGFNWPQLRIHAIPAYGGVFSKYSYFIEGLTFWRSFFDFFTISEGWMGHKSHNPSTTLPISRYVMYRPELFNPNEMPSQPGLTRTTTILRPTSIFTHCDFDSFFGFSVQNLGSRLWISPPKASRTNGRSRDQMI